MMLLSWVLAALYGGQWPAYVVVGLSMLLLAFNRMYFELLCGFFFLLLLSDNLDERLWFAKSFKNIYILFLSVIFFSDRKSFSPYSTIVNLFLPFFISAVFALQFSGKLDVGIQKTLSYLLLLISVPNFLKFLFRQRGPVFLRDLVYFFVLIIIIGYLVKYVSLNFAYIEGNRMRGLFGNPNGLGIFLFLFFSFFTIVNQFYPSLFSKKDKRIVYIVVIAALIFCSSRTAFISILILLIFNRINLVSPLIGFVVLVSFILSYEYIVINFVSIVRSFGLEDYFRINTLEEGSGRFIAWSFGWQKIQDFYFFGGGLGNDEYIMRQYYSMLTKLGHQGGVHNSYLTLWFDVGLIGLLIYLRSFFLIFIKGAKKTGIAVPFMYSVMFSMMYESWVAGSLNPFTIVLFFSLTLLYEDEFVPEPLLPSDATKENELNIQSKVLA